jgi:hypothetical protein
MPTATRRRSNHAKNTVGKRCAGKLPARIERGMETGPLNGPVPLTTNGC